MALAESDINGYTSCISYVVACRRRSRWAAEKNEREFAFGIFYSNSTMAKIQNHFHIYLPSLWSRASIASAWMTHGYWIHVCAVSGGLWQVLGNIKLPCRCEHFTIEFKCLNERRARECACANMTENYGDIFTSVCLRYVSEGFRIWSSSPHIFIYICFFSMGHSTPLHCTAVCQSLSPSISLPLSPPQNIRKNERCSPTWHGRLPFACRFIPWTVTYKCVNCELKIDFSLRVVVTLINWRIRACCSRLCMSVCVYVWKQVYGRVTGICAWTLAKTSRLLAFRWCMAVMYEIHSILFGPM